MNSLQSQSFVRLFGVKKYYKKIVVVTTVISDETLLTPHLHRQCQPTVKSIAIEFGNIFMWAFVILTKALTKWRRAGMFEL